MKIRFLLFLLALAILCPAAESEQPEIKWYQQTRDSDVYRFLPPAQQVSGYVWVQVGGGPASTGGYAVTLTYADAEGKVLQETKNAWIPPGMPVANVAFVRDNIKVKTISAEPIARVGKATTVEAPAR